MKPIKKTRKEANPNYVRWINSWDCCIPGCSTPWPVQAHHVFAEGLDTTISCLPLCRQHHIGTNGVHFLGQKIFENKFNINLISLVNQYNSYYRQGVQGCRRHKSKKH